MNREKMFSHVRNLESFKTLTNTLEQIPDERLLIIIDKALQELEQNIYYKELQHKKIEWTGREENVLEWITKAKTADCTIGQGKYITVLKKIHEKRPEDFSCWYENKNGSVFCTIPLNWIAIRPPKQMNLTDEQKKERAERLRLSRNIDSTDAKEA